MGIMAFSSKRTGRRKWIAAIPVLAGAFFMFIYLPPDPFFKRFSEVSEQQISTLGGRLLFLKQTPPLIEKYAAFGCGLGGFESAFFRTKDILPGHIVDYAHNDYVQLLVELGIIGFVILAVLIGGVFRKAIRTEHIACVGALSAILLHSFFDFNLYIPANAMVVAWVAGMAASPNAA
jgi:O-antigen ligase